MTKTRKSTQRLIVQLEHDLALAKNSITYKNIFLERISRGLAQAIDKKLEIVSERDALQRQIGLEREEHKAKEDQLRQELDDLRRDCDNLDDVNRQNYDRAYRNSEVAAILAFLLATNASVPDVMLKFAEAANQMGVSSDMVDVRNALKRGFAARIDQMVDDMLANRAKINIPTDISDEVVS